ncbi:MAG: hypothetical protein M1826_006339 [Phylliscum demangeonii]|nr:MAG: hypothetical protein M1826_006339 [Phylliscum demangeonii]
MPGDLFHAFLDIPETRITTTAVESSSRWIYSRGYQAYKDEIQLDGGQMLYGSKKAARGPCEGSALAADMGRF